MTDQHGSYSPVLIDQDGEHFKRHVAAITDELRTMLNLYLGPRTRGRLVDLFADLDELVAAYSREHRG